MGFAAGMRILPGVFLVTSCSLVAASSVLANFEPVLLFPQSTLFQFTVGVGTPIAMDKKGGIGFNSGFQFNYALPWNLSQFESTIVHARTARQATTPSLNLDNVYFTIEEFLEDHGWDNGRECLLRVICELAQTPLVRGQDGRRDVLEEIVHLLLTRPSEEEDIEEENPYVEAELLGHRDEDCGTAYVSCLQSPLDSFTEIVAPGFG